MSSHFNECAAATAGMNDLAVLQCVSDRLEAEAAERTAGLTEWLLVVAGALVFFMQAGFAMLCAGCVRKKNVQK